MVVSYIIHFRDKARYWLKIAIFRTPFAFDPPISIPLQICIYLVLFMSCSASNNGANDL